MKFNYIFLIAIYIYTIGYIKVQAIQVQVSSSLQRQCLSVACQNIDHLKDKIYQLPYQLQWKLFKRSPVLQNAEVIQRLLTIAKGDISKTGAQWVARQFKPEQLPYCVSDYVFIPAVALVNSGAKYRIARALLEQHFKLDTPRPSLLLKNQIITHQSGLEGFDFKQCYYAQISSSSRLSSLYTYSIYDTLNNSTCLKKFCVNNVGHKSFISTLPVAISPDKRFVAIPSGNYLIRLYDCTYSQFVVSFFYEKDKKISKLFFNAAGDQLAVFFKDTSSTVYTLPYEYLYHTLDFEDTLYLFIIITSCEQTYVFIKFFTSSCHAG